MSYGKDVCVVCAFLIGAWIVAVMGGSGDPLECLSSATIKIPVMNGTRGAQVVDASIFLKHGTGMVLVDIGDAYVDDYKAQPMIKDAVIAAFRVTGIKLDKYDVVVSFDRVDGATIKGDSMGAAVACGVVAAVMKREIVSSAVITGAVRQDGRIMSAGKILDKARALKDEGVDTFLVPVGNAIDVNYVERKVCAEGSDCVGVVEKEEIDVGQVVGIDVIEVANLEDALRYMLK